MESRHQLRIMRTALLAGLALAVAGCGGADDPEPVAACALADGGDDRLSGAYLRQSEAAQGFEALVVSGVEAGNGMPQSLAFDDQNFEKFKAGDAGLTGSGGSNATARAGFGAAGSLPAVYDFLYEAEGSAYAGAMVVGPMPDAAEIPGAGGASHSGRIEVGLGAPASDGQGMTAQATGRFTLVVGYGTRRAELNAELSGGGLPFTRLRWTNLFLCGARFVSSGQGQITVTDAAGATGQPFGQGDQPVPFRAAFESSLFASGERPAPPDAVGGVFMIESDVGAITGVFLSDQQAGSP